MVSSLPSRPAADPALSCFHTSGQVAKSLRISVSTLKRWLEEYPGLALERKNANGWRLFSEEEIEGLRHYKRHRRRDGKVFRPETLQPIDDHV